MDILTVKELGTAISYALNICKEKAELKADIVMDVFGFEERIVDNCLSTEARKLFYLLEKKGLLNTESEDIILFNRKIWRMHYWKLKKKQIEYYINMKERAKKKKTFTTEMQSIRDNVYLHLPREIWFSHKAV